MTNETIPFNRVFLTGNETRYIGEAIESGNLSGDGGFTKLCSEWLKERFGFEAALLTPSGTAALEMAALLVGLNKNDEVIMPSYTFSSTANAFILHGGVPVFVDVEGDTMNVDPQKIRNAITSKTKAIVVVHYAGLVCDMMQIMAIAKAHNLIVIEDAAQAFLSSDESKYAGTFGDLACFSFHATKNIISGEGGALAINNRCYLERAEIIREKGTNRNKFLNGLVDKYTWVDCGSSFLPNEITAAFLYAQLQKSERITLMRKEIFQLYATIFDKAGFANFGWRKQKIKFGHTSNAHIFFMIAPNKQKRAQFISYLSENGITATSHYEPLHTSIFGQGNSKKNGSLSVTEDFSYRLVRLPLWPGLKHNDLDRISNVMTQFLL